MFENSWKELLNDESKKKRERINYKSSAAVEKSRVVFDGGLGTESNTRENECLHRTMGSDGGGDRWD